MGSHDASKRKRLPDTRPAVTRKYEACGFELYVLVGFYDGTAEESATPGEVFITISKHGTELSGIVDGLATTISVALQYGVPWEVLRDKYLSTRFGQGPDAAGNSSLLDGIAKAIDSAIASRRSTLGLDEPKVRA